MKLAEISKIPPDIELTKLTDVPDEDILDHAVDRGSTLLFGGRSVVGVFARLRDWLSDSDHVYEIAYNIPDQKLYFFIQGKHGSNTTYCVDADLAREMTSKQNVDLAKTGCAFSKAQEVLKSGDIVKLSKYVDFGRMT